MGGDGGSEGLGLGVAPHLTLVGLGHRHVRGLSTTVAHGMADMASMVANQLGGGGRHQGGDAHESLWQKTLLISENTALPPALIPSPSSLWLLVGLMLSPGPRGLYSVRPKVHRRLDGLVVGRRWLGGPAGLCWRRRRNRASLLSLTCSPLSSYDVMSSKTLDTSPFPSLLPLPACLPSCPGSVEAQQKSPFQ